MTKPYLNLLCHLLQLEYDINDSLDQLQNYSDDDWEQLINLAEQYSLLAILHARLKVPDRPPNIPAPLIKRMRTAYLANATRNTLFLHEAGFILNDLKNAGIPTIGLKGIYLLDNIYKDIGIRQMSDLDIMLHKIHIPQALNILDNLGYHPTTYFDIHNENLDIKHVPPLLKPQGPYYVELHWTILEENEPFTIDAEGLWARAVPATIASVDALAISPEDLILHLCLHLSYQHHFNIGLRGLVDITAVLHHFESQVDWDKLVNIAQNWKATRVAWLTLTLAQDLLAVKIPFNVLAQLQPAGIDPWVQAEARSQLLERNPHASPITPDLALLASEKSIFQRSKRILNRIFLPKPTLARLYNVPPTSIRIYGCYFKRLGDLFQAYAPTIKRVFKSDEAVFEDVRKEQFIKDLRNWMTKN